MRRGGRRRAAPSTRCSHCCCSSGRWRGVRWFRFEGETIGEIVMVSLRIWIILSWIALPTVMFGGYSLLRLLNRGGALTQFQIDCFRAGHAHAGVLLLMSLLYYMFLDRTALPVSV